MLLTLAIAGYRSLREAIRLLADVAQGRIISSLVSEGGLHSTLWLGPERFSCRSFGQHTC